MHNDKFLQAKPRLLGVSGEIRHILFINFKEILCQTRHLVVLPVCVVEVKPGRLGEGLVQPEGARHGVLQAVAPRDLPGGGRGRRGEIITQRGIFPNLWVFFFFLLYCLEHVSQVGPVLPGAHVGEHDHHRVDLGAGPALQEAGHPDQAVVLLRRRWGGEGGEEIQRFSTFFVVDVGERDPLLRPLPQHPLNHSDPQYFTVYFDPLYTSL